MNSYKKNGKEERKVKWESIKWKEKDRLKNRWKKTCKKKKDKQKRKKTEAEQNIKKGSARNKKWMLI